MNLLATNGYKRLNREAVLTIVNGCGPEGFKFKLDKVLGVNLFEACAIHDYDYFIGGTAKDRKRADLYFIINCMILTLEHDSWHNTYRLIGCCVFYGFVRVLGRKHFSYH